VKRRLIDAAELIERTSRAAGPSRKMTSWVDWQLFRGVTDFERNAMAEGLKEGTRQPDRGINRAAGAREIAAAEDAMQWPIRYVAGDGERRALALWIFCDLTGAPFGRLSPKIAGSRGTAYRRLDKALSRIVAGLHGDGVGRIDRPGPSWPELIEMTCARPHIGRNMAAISFNHRKTN